MTFPLTLLDLAGAVALLLWGVRMVQTGVQRAFGAQLRGFLATALRTRAMAFAAGLGITAVLQSSTATGLMITGFAAGGLVDLVPALAVMLGANVGTTLIVQVLSFDVASVAPALILIGVLTFQRATAGPRDFGRVLIGLGLMLMALRLLLDLVTPYEDVPSLRLLLGVIATEPLLDVVLAAGLTWAAHSSVAIVLLTMSLAAKGVVPPHAAFALVLGANLGSAINPCLEGAGGADPVARRVPLGNLLSRLAGVIVALAFLAPVGRQLVQLIPDAERAVAVFHTAFNLAVAAVLMPVLPAYAALLHRLLPARIDVSDPGRPIYLDPASAEVPAVALGAAAREALRLVDVLDMMMTGLRDGLEDGDRRRIAESRRLDEVLESLSAAIRVHLTALDPDAMTEADRHRAADILSFATNLEHAGDVLDRNLLGHALRGLRRGPPFSPAELAELQAAIDRLQANLRGAAAVFVNGDVRTARLLATEKEVFRDIETRASATYLDRLRIGQGAQASSPIHLDAIRDIKRVNAHIVAAAAYPVLERSGELLPTRLRQDEGAPSA